MQSPDEIGLLLAEMETEVAKIRKGELSASIQLVELAKSIASLAALVPPAPEYQSKASKSVTEARIRSLDAFVLRNADDLLLDANILFDNGRFARATATAILAGEEYGKALVLRARGVTLWTDDLPKFLRVHLWKQLFGVLTVEYVKEVASAVYRGQGQALPHAISVFGIAEDVYDAKYPGLRKQILKKKTLDTQKQNGLYVDLNPDATHRNEPWGTSAEEAAIAIDKAAELQAYCRAISDAELLSQFAPSLGLTGHDQFSFSGRFDGMHIYFQNRKGLDGQAFYDEIVAILNVKSSEESYLPNTAIPAADIEHFVNENVLIEQVVEQMKLSGRRYSALLRYCRAAVGQPGGGVVTP